MVVQVSIPSNFYYTVHTEQICFLESDGSSNMVKSEADNKVEIDGVEYKFDDLTDNAKAQIINIQFVDTQLQQLNNEWAVCDTARIGYTNALKAEFKQVDDG